MLALDLTKVQPFDVLLTTNFGVESAAIRGAQSIVHGEKVEFSHAAMFIAPTVLIESSDAGTVFETFSNDVRKIPSSNDPKNMERDARFDANLPARLETQLFGNTSGGRISIYGGLPKAKTARVIRHKKLLNMSRAEYGTFREKFFERLSLVYLLAYPSFVRLLATGPFSKELIDTMTDIVAGFAGDIKNPGPFCSQLVCHLLTAIEAKVSDRPPEVTDPWQLAKSNEFDEVDCVLNLADAQHSKPIPDIENLLRIDATPLFSPLMVESQTIVDRIIQFERTGSVDGVVYRRPEHAAFELEVMREWCAAASDPFWQWREAADECFKSCPQKKHEGLTSPTLKKFAGDRCDNPTHCGMHSLKEIREQFDAITDRRLRRFADGLEP